MKKYILAALLAAFVLIGPSVGSANAQGYFYRGGPTFVDRLFGNGGGYGGGYGNYGGYGGFNPYNTSMYRGGYANPFAGYGGGYGGFNRFNNCGWHHHHHHW
jgi:hypothetical protein